MKHILITGTQGLAQSLAQVYKDHAVTLVSKSTGHNIHQVSSWGSSFLHYDTLINCAYDGFGQIAVLEYFFQAWKSNPNKVIVNIGSKAADSSRSEIDQQNHYWSYRLHKQALTQAHQTMSLRCQCTLKLVNPGAFESAMTQHLTHPKMPSITVAQHVRQCIEDPLMKRMDLWL